MASPSLSSPQNPSPTTAIIAITSAVAADDRPNPKPPSSSSRRLPPPCWSHEETEALIDSYRDKWYSLRRGNLKASHWQEVADAVAARCPFANPSKTSVQCRHKVEKLRKRYRTEKQKALTNPGRFSSSWVYFRKMDSMEKGTSSSSAAAPPRSNTTDEDDDDDDENENEDDGGDDYDPMPPPTNTRSLHRLMNNGVSSSGRTGGGVGGFRLRIPSRPTSNPLPPPVMGFRSKSFDENPNVKPNNHNPSRYLNGCSSSKSSFGRRSDGGGGGVKREMDPVSEMVTSIKMLGEGFVKMEQMKIEVAREIERMRMDMEMKRTEMILESQQRIVEAFAKGFSGKKKIKRVQSPDS